MDGPIGITAVAGRHVLRQCGVAVIAPHAPMSSDALTLGEDLHRPCRDPRFDFCAGEAMRHAVIVMIDIDVIIDADAAHAPFSKDVRLCRQRLESGSIEVFEKLTSGHAETPDQSILVEPFEQFGDCCVNLSETEEDAIAQTTKQESLDDENSLFDGLAGRIAVP